MALPTRVPCKPCGVDTLHVWDKEERAWRCNGCKNVVHPIASPTLMEKISYKDKVTRQARAIAGGGGKPRTVSWAVQPGKKSEKVNVNPVTDRKSDDSKRQVRLVGVGLARISVEQDATNGPTLRRDNERYSEGHTGVVSEPARHRGSNNRAGATESKAAIEERCRMFCAWKGGGPCLLTSCPRRNNNGPGVGI